jgi:VLRF1 release factor-like protein
VRASGQGGRPAAGGGRWVEVPPERLTRWLENFADRHGDTTAARTGEGLLVTAADGATADCHLPLGWPEGTDDFVAAAGRDARVGLLLARRGGYAIGVAEGEKLVSSKVDSRYVQGRTAAGGWSQQRFARRRDNQTRESAQAAAGVALRLLVPAAATLEALVTGGDKQLVAAILVDPRLAGLDRLPRGPFLAVPEPRHADLVEAAQRYRRVAIRVVDPVG